MLAWHLTIARDYEYLDRIFWGTDYVGADTTSYLDFISKELDFFRNQLNPILEASGWPILTSHQINGLLGENFRRFMGL
jgi:hypothetical protein